ncbi:MAG TPA: 4Fe-4S dicluster domain-containing protein [Phycisphaerales bacterium]|nr:4Fe-4S dicluster domain-containing protein [Phycisphaerales bacterium]
MKFHGGYNVSLEGRPVRKVKVTPLPEKLYLPLGSQRFNFTDVCVSEGDHVRIGEIIAKDTDNYDVPLLAPLSGTVKLNEVEGHIVIANTGTDEDEDHGHYEDGDSDRQHIAEELGAAGIKRYRLLSLGAWQFFTEAFSGTLPDPLGKPQAIIVSTLALEPFLARGDVQLRNRMLQFTRGLEQLQSLLEYQPIYLIVPKTKSDLIGLIQNHIRGHAWAKIITIPMKYGYEHPKVLARALGLKSADGPVWTLRTEGVLAVDRALTHSKPCTVRIVAVGGPGAKSPIHIKAFAGYPIETIKQMFMADENVKLIKGGFLTGDALTDKDVGLEADCMGITMLPELQSREFLGFMRPGFDRQSYSECFMSTLCGSFAERLTDAIHGEGRPCISCNYCEEVCPAQIMPHLIHKYLYRDLLEEVDQARVDLCVQCGLCSFVCPSKIELRQQFSDALVQIAEEKEQIRLEEVRQQKLRAEEEQRKQENS